MIGIDISTNISEVLDRLGRKKAQVPSAVSEAVEAGSRILEREVLKRLPKSRTGRLRRSLFRQVIRVGEDVTARVGVNHPGAKALEGGAFIKANGSGALAIPILRGLPPAKEVQASPLRFGYRRTFVRGRAVMGVPLLSTQAQPLYALVPWVRLRAVRYMSRARSASLRQMKQLLKLSVVKVFKGGGR